MDEREVRDELRELAARLKRIEAYLGLVSRDARPPGQRAEELPATPEKPGTELREPRAGKQPDEAPVPGPVPLPPVLPTYRRPDAERASAPLRAPDKPTPEPVTAPGAVPKERTPLELLIAERWMAWVGAIVVVAAVGFFVKLAYDLGWWGRIPPLGKCALSATFGVLLIAGGEWALRKVGRIAAVSLFGAGLGTLYLTAYATFRFFDLLSQSGAFWLMALVAVLGVAITVRGRLLSIGVLALLGGYLSPVLLSEQVTFAAALPLYATALLVVALTLSLAWPAPFRVLRYVGLGLHALVASLWMLREGSDHWLIAMIFLTLWWVLVSAEALRAALRGQSARGNPVATLLFTLWYVSTGCGVLAAAEPGARNWLGLFAGAVAAVCAWAALAFGPGLAVLKVRPRRSIELQAATLWAQVGVLVAAAFALHFRDPGESYGQTIAWLAMAVACVEIGRRLPSRGVSVFGLLVGALALVRVWEVDRELAVLRTVFWAYGDVSVNYWALIALGAVAATHIVALRWRWARQDGMDRLAVGLCVLSVLQWMAIVLLRCEGLALTAGWLLAAVALLAAAPFITGSAHAATALFVLAAAGAKWIIADAVWPRMETAWNPSAMPVLINWQMAIALAIALCGYWVYRLWPSESRKSATPQTPRTAWQYAQGVLFGAICFLLLALSFEVDRLLAQGEHAQPAGATSWSPLIARVLWWTLLWAIGGLVSWAFGRGGRLPLVRDCGMAVLLAATMVWLTLGTLYPRVEQGVVLCPVVVNLQFGVGAALAVIVGAVVYVVRRFDAPTLEQNLTLRGAVHVALALIAAIGLWLASLELDRFFAPEAARVSNPAMARQTALSICWGLYGIGLVALGFWRRSALTRYVGLGLLAVTLGKVMLVDLANVRYVYRVLSLLAVGLLFIGTSVAYARLASRLRTRPPLSG